MREDTRVALHVLRQWHRDRAGLAASMLKDKRASRHTQEDHRRTAEFHEHAVRTLDAVILAVEGPPLTPKQVQGMDSTMGGL